MKFVDIDTKHQLVDVCSTNSVKRFELTGVCTEPSFPVMIGDIDYTIDHLRFDTTIFDSLKYYFENYRLSVKTYLFWKTIQRKQQTFLSPS